MEDSTNEKNGVKIIKNQEKENVIILNKAFEGSWNDKEGNISHEIIDFFLDDNGKHYIYNTPHGTCRDGVNAEWLIITSSATIMKETNQYSFNLLYKMEIEKKLNRKSKYVTNKNKSRFKGNIENNIKSIKEDCKDIRYGSVSICDIFKNGKDFGKVPLATFQGEGVMYEAKNPIKIVVDNGNYNYWRTHCGYVYETQHSSLYNKLIYEINNENNWESIKLEKIESQQNGNCKKSISSNKKTFLELILKVNSEECYTNILYSILNYKNLIIDFVNKYQSKTHFNVTQISNLNIYRENSIVNGRMDILAEFKYNDESFVVIIENKIHSGLNGKKEDDSTQLNKYYKWACDKIKKETNILCFITCPNYRAEDIDCEIKVCDKKSSQKMKDIYNIITYSELVAFIEENKNKNCFNDYAYGHYIDEIINIFKKHAYESKLEKFEQDFLDAIQLANN